MSRRRFGGKRRNRSPGRTKEAKEKGIRPLEPIRREQLTPRNALCPCGSLKKYKKCCGRPAPPLPEVKYETVRDRYTPEERTAEREFVTQWGFVPSPALLAMHMDGDTYGITQIVVDGLMATGAKPAHIKAVQTLHRLITPKNQKLVSQEVRDEWDRIYKEGDDDGDERHDPVSCGPVPEEGGDGGGC